ncbi:Hypothetical predicted protein [Mytilus galloprovincialis]|uniref:C1q domain-containing protein n=1 Tax=Mytilus galloprovincialis TaxID=29158 RepID=A0A8B6E925_MYTGA|nr:Hypothetical predicted protein [Mytilus galloprovincialis]
MNQQILIFCILLIVQTVNGNWTKWTSCSVTCGRGTRVRYLRLPTYTVKQTAGCTKIGCPVDGNWGPWSIFGPCSVTCGTGLYYRNRICNDPAPAHNGKPCDGEESSSEICNTKECAAFTATLPGGVHPYQNGAFIGYPIKLLNNSGYSNGIFTVLPGMGGVYLVSVTMMSGSVTGHTTLRKNGAIYVWLFTNKEYDMASQTINIQLAEGDRIWVQMTNQASSLFDVYNTFSAIRIV